MGDFAMWDSDREMEFRVLEPLHKLTLLIPKPRMKAFLGDAERYAGQVVPGSAGAGGIAAKHSGAWRGSSRPWTSTAPAR